MSKREEACKDVRREEGKEGGGRREEYRESARREDFKEPARREEYKESGGRREESVKEGGGCRREDHKVISLKNSHFCLTSNDRIVGERIIRRTRMGVQCWEEAGRRAMEQQCGLQQQQNRWNSKVW